jgi:hypothetical protein
MNANELRANLAPLTKALGALAQMNEMVDAAAKEDLRMRTTQKEREQLQQDIAALKLERDKITKALADVKLHHASATSDLMVVQKDLDAGLRKFATMSADHAAGLQKAKDEHDQALADDLKQHEIAVSLVKSAYEGAQAELNAAKNRLADFHSNVLSATKR